jgi:hypothetical protein
VPMDFSFPRPSSDRCPRCDAPLAGSPCRTCGLVLARDDAADLWRIDSQLHRLSVQRRELLGRIDARSAAAAAAPVRVPPPPPAPRSGAGVTLPNLLLGLGTALIIVAAIVFAAVRWSDLGATVQALVLFGLTAGTGWATRLIHRHGLTATAEAVSVITVALLPVDGHALREAAEALSWSSGPGGDPLVYWCLAIWAAAAVTWWFGRFSGTRAPRIIAAIAAQVPVPLYVIDRPVDAPAGQLLCLGQAAVAMVAVRRTPGAAAGARATAVLGAVGTWLVVTPLALALAVDGETAERLGGAGVLAAAAAVAGLVAALWPDGDTARPLALGAATAVGLAAVGVGVSAGVTGDAWWPIAACACAVVVVGSARLPGRWAGPPAVVAAGLGTLASLPLAGVALDALGAALAAGDHPWTHEAGTPVRSLADPPIGLPAPGLVVAQFVVVVAAVLGVAASGRIGRQAAERALSALAVAAALAAPLVADLSVGATVGLTLAAAGGAMAWAARPRGSAAGVPPPALAVAGLSGAALLWSLAASGTTVVAVGVVAALAGGLAAAAVRDGSEAVAVAAAAGAVVAVASEAGAVTLALVGTAAEAWLAVGLSALAATFVAAALDWPGTGVDLARLAAVAVAGRQPAGRVRPDLARLVGAIGEGTAVAVHLVALLATASLDDTGAASVLLAAGAATSGAHTLRPGRRVAAIAGAAEGVALIWVRLAVAEVDVAEAYTAPVAVAFLAAALVAHRTGVADRNPSWAVHGPWLIMAVAPTMLVALDDPGLVRPLGGLVAGAAVLVAGAVSRRRAAVDVGTITVVVLGLRQLAPVVGALPNWATLGACGLFLLAVGATFEERRRNVATIRDRYASLA